MHDGRDLIIFFSGCLGSSLGFSTGRLLPFSFLISKIYSRYKSGSNSFKYIPIGA
jgi:hypothetical protein